MAEDDDGGAGAVRLGCRRWCVEVRWSRQVEADRCGRREWCGGRRRRRSKGSRERGGGSRRREGAVMCTR